MIFESTGPLSAHEEQALVQRLLCGDEEAVRTIYARFARPVYGLGLRLLGSAEAAEELTQDVFLTAWRKAARFDASRGRLSTWLMAIAHNLAVDPLRRGTRGAGRAAPRPHPRRRPAPAGPRGGPAEPRPRGGGPRAGDGVRRGTGA